VNHKLIKAECAPVIQHLLGSSILFEHDPQELDIWLNALPRSLRSPDAKSPDGAALLDEKSSVLSVVDEALKRCLKSPYKYVETVIEFAHNSSPNTTGNSYGPPLLPSPLLMAVIEVMNDCATGVAQAPPSALLALATYIRRVIFGWHLKQPNTQYSRRILEYIISLRIPNQGTLTSHPAIGTGILREWHLLTDIFDALDQSWPSMNESNPAVEDFTHHLEQMTIGELRLPQLPDSSITVHAEGAKVKHAAYQLIDWVRLVDQPIGHEQMIRLAKLLKSWHPPALAEFFLQVGPRNARLASLISHIDHTEECVLSLLALDHRNSFPPLTVWNSHGSTPARAPKNS
jgi:nucleolar pre-ribosomal-associated protein 1